jgi:maltooligosyltrehalose trehalohydrolase
MRRALTTLLLLGPWTPMLFQGQEWASSRRFRYFADHHPELAALVRKGRAEFMAQFPSAASPAVQSLLPDPAARGTFESSWLDWGERDGERGRQSLALHSALLRLRAADPLIRAVNAGAARFDGAVLGPQCFLLRYFAVEPKADHSGAGDRLLLVNCGGEAELAVAPEPLLAPPHARRWQIILGSEDPSFGGAGNPALESDDEGWRIPGAAAFFLEAV